MPPSRAKTHHIFVQDHLSQRPRRPAIRYNRLHWPDRLPPAQRRATLSRRRSRWRCVNRCNRIRVMVIGLRHFTHLPVLPKCSSPTRICCPQLHVT